MNALINDQLKRLRHVLAGTGVTFARYTGDTPENPTSAQERNQSLRPAEAPAEERYYREEFTASPPQIALRCGSARSHDFRGSVMPRATLPRRRAHPAGFCGIRRDSSVCGNPRCGSRTRPGPDPNKH